MTSPTPPAGIPDSDDVLKEHTRQLTRQYRARLKEAFEDDVEAGRRFYAEASRRSPADAAMAMREEPQRFGSLRDRGAAAATEAGMLGARAYHSRLAEGDPKLGAAVLDQAFMERLRAVEGVDAERVRGTWDALSAGYGADEAARVLTRRSREVLGASATPADAQEVARFAAARDHLRERAGISREGARAPSPPLPRVLEDLAGTDAPAWVRERLLAASDGLRKRLRGAYLDPVAAEARLHRALDQDGPAALEAARRYPASLGPLRRDLTGGTEQAEAVATLAMDYAAIAYEYHRVRGPAEVDALRARDALLSTRRSARDVEAAMEAIQEAVQLSGPELRRHLGRAREPGVGRGGRGDGGRGPDGHGPPGEEGPDHAPARGEQPRDTEAEVSRARGEGASRARPRERKAERTGDPAVEEAIRAHEELDEARELNTRLRQLREERSAAQRKLAELKEDQAAVKRARRDLRAVAGEIYRDPDGAIRNWQKLVAEEKGSIEKARDRLVADPSLLGPLRSDPEPGFLRRAAQVAGRAIGMSAPGEEPPGDEALSRLGARAATFARAEAALERPVEWTTPDGKTVTGREEVREAAKGVADSRQREIDRGEKRLDRLGGVRGAERNVQHALDGLTPRQKREAVSRIAQSAGKPGVNVVAGLARKTIEAARVARVLGEGSVAL
jgi:hypothetical protein